MSIDGRGALLISSLLTHINNEGYLSAPACTCMSWLNPFPLPPSSEALENCTTRDTFFFPTARRYTSPPCSLTTQTNNDWSNILKGRLSVFMYPWVRKESQKKVRRTQKLFLLSKRFVSLISFFHPWYRTQPMFCLGSRYPFPDTQSEPAYSIIFFAL